MKERIGELGIWIFLQVCLGAYRRVGRVANELGGEVRDGLRTADALVVQEPVVRSAEADGTSFQPILFCCVFVSSGTSGGSLEVRIKKVTML